MLKKCRICLQEKDKTLFSKNSRSSDNLKNTCKSCDKDIKTLNRSQEQRRNREYSIQNREKLNKYHRQWYRDNGEKVKTYCERYAEKTKEYKKKYHQQNRARMQARRRKYRLEHREQRRQYERQNRQLNIDIRIRQNIRSRIRSFLKKDKKIGSAVSYLGCSVGELKLYLECKFQPGMTWSNWSKNGWHIDHIKPLCSFELTDIEQFKQACHYTNLQPLWSTDNLIKGGKFESILSLIVVS
jgi:hypothetical protein